jgi:hypothetical protein
MSMRRVDLRILVLADAKLLPEKVQQSFDHWRIWRAREAVATTVRKRLLNATVENLPTLQIYLERLEQADTEQNIFEGIYALAQAVEHNRQQLGIHSDYVVLIMSGHLNPWGLLEFQQDFELPAASVIAAAEELWRLATENHLNVSALLAQIKDDKTLAALEAHRSENADGHPVEALYASEAETSADLTVKAQKPVAVIAAKVAKKKPVKKTSARARAAKEKTEIEKTKKSSAAQEPRTNAKKN